MQQCCVHIVGIPVWKPLECQERKKKKREAESRGEHIKVAGPYWRVRSLSACGGRAAASTPRPLAACPGPSLLARQEPRRPPGPGARTLVARPLAPGWQDGPLGPPDLQLGNTSMKRTGLSCVIRCMWTSVFSAYFLLFMK